MHDGHRNEDAQLQNSREPVIGNRPLHVRLFLSVQETGVILIIYPFSIRVWQFGHSGRFSTLSMVVPSRLFYLISLLYKRLK